MDEQRLQEIEMRLRKQTPCAHENHDVRLGDGTTWAKCEDCQATFKRSSLSRVAKSAREYEDAIDALIAEVRRLQQEQEWWTAVNAELLPYQERAVKAEQQRDAAIAEARLQAQQNTSLREDCDFHIRQRDAALVERDTAIEARDCWHRGYTTVSAERDKALQFIEARGYRRCDAAACNCYSWHGGHTTAILSEIESALNEADMPWRGTILATVKSTVAALTEARRVLREVRPMLCDILKLTADVGAGNDYEAVARVIDQIDDCQRQAALGMGEGR